MRVLVSATQTAHPAARSERATISQRRVDDGTRMVRVSFEQTGRAGTRPAEQGAPDQQCGVAECLARALLCTVGNRLDACHMHVCRADCHGPHLSHSLTTFRPRREERKNQIQKMEETIFALQAKRGDCHYKNGDGTKPNQRAASNKQKKELEALSEDFEDLKKRPRARRHG